MSWNDYNKNTKDKPAHPLLLEALTYAADKNRALDLGCGAMRDTKAMLNAGFNLVDAVDSNSDIEKIAKEIQGYDSRLKFYACTFDKFEFPLGAYDLVNAQYALPFVGPMRFESLWEKIKSSLKQDGIFVGNFFGDKDEWSKNPNLLFHTRTEVLRIFNKSDWSLAKLDEYCGMGKIADGSEKFWNFFNVIAFRVGDNLVSK